jgi:hypothetical protein
VRERERGGGGLKERDHVEDVGIDESIILKCTLKKWDKRERTDLIYVV